MKYPDNCKTKKDKTEFAYLVQEQLRIEHNLMGQKRKRGEITQAEFDDYKRKVFRPAQLRISQEIIKNRDETIIDNAGTDDERRQFVIDKESMKNSKRWDIDLKEI